MAMKFCHPLEKLNVTRSGYKSSLKIQPNSPNPDCFSCGIRHKVYISTLQKILRKKELWELFLADLGETIGKTPQNIVKIRTGKLTIHFKSPVAINNSILTITGIERTHVYYNNVFTIDKFHIALLINSKILHNDITHVQC